MTPLAVVQEHLESLKQSPLAQLSLSSRELFHSNFLAWLCENHGAFASELFGAFLARKPSGGIKEVCREEKNIDLLIRFVDGQELIVENKVKSLPDSTQLAEYSAKFHSEHSSFLLLSLSHPHFISSSVQTYKDSGGKTWNILMYGELSRRIEAILQSELTAPEAGSYHRLVIEDYVKYIGALANLGAYFDVAAQPDASFFEGTDRIGELCDDRFGSGFVKMRYSHLAGMLNEQLQGLGFETVTEPSAYWRPANAYPLVWAGMTRSLGLLDFKYPLIGTEGLGAAPPVTLGVQLQGNSFRLVVECHRRDAALVAELFKQSNNGHPGWFDFGLLPLPCDGEEYPSKRDFNKFGKEFLYRSKKVDHAITPAGIVKVIVAYAEFISENRDALRERAIALYS